MKKNSHKIISLSLLFLILFPLLVFSQGTSHELFIPPPTGPTDPNLYLNNPIMGDSNANGTRKDPDRVYVLQRGGTYFVTATIKNPSWTLRIKAQDGTGPRPIIYMYPTGTTLRQPTFIDVRSTVSLKNILVSGYFEAPNQPLYTTYVGDQQSYIINTGASDCDIVIDSCILLNVSGQPVRTDNVPRLVKVTNTIFGNMGWLGTSNLGAGKGIDVRGGSVDSLIVLNCTFINYQDRVIRHNYSTAPINYLRFDHNTLVNGMSYHGMLALGKVGTSIIITNNLLYDAFALGNDTDATRQIEFSEGQEKDPYGNWRMTWVIASPNDATEYTISNNYYCVSAAGQNFLNTYKLTEGSPLNWHVNEKLGIDSTKVFIKTDITLKKITNLMLAMMNWYRSPTGGNKTKSTATWSIAYDYDRRMSLFYRDTLDCSYTNTHVAYTGAIDGFPVGDLNWFPVKKKQWETLIELFPLIQLSTNIFNFSAYQNSALPNSQSFTISNGGNGTLSWIAIDNANWLDISPTSGTNTGTITASINTTSMNPGTYTASISITASGASNSPQTVSVTYTILGKAPDVTTSTTSSVTTSSATVSGSVNPNGILTNAWFEWGTNSTLSYYDSTIKQSVGSGKSEQMITDVISGLRANTLYYFRIAAQNSSGISKGKILSFTTKNPVISLSDQEIVFTANQEDTLPADQYLIIRNIGDDTLKWSVKTDKEWLEVYPKNGVDSGKISVKIKSTNFKAGIYIGRLEFSQGGKDSIASVIVKYNIRGPHLSVDLNQLNFQRIVPGRSKELNVKLQNDSIAILKISNLRLIGTNQNLFSILNSSGSYSLRQGETQSFTIRFTADSILGTKTAILEILSNDSLQYPFQVLLIGEVAIPHKINKLSPDSLSAEINNELSEPLTVEVIDSLGRNLAGVSLEFTIIDKPSNLTIEPSITPKYSITDDSGRAKVIVKLGDKIGEYQIKVQDSLRLLNPITYIFTATAGAPSNLLYREGNNQAGEIKTSLPISFKVRVTDHGANRLMQIKVNFNIIDFPLNTQGQNCVKEVLTDQDGEAATRLTLGDKVGKYVVRASILNSNLPSIDFIATAEEPKYPSAISLDRKIIYPNYSKPTDYKTSDWRMIGLPGFINLNIIELFNGNKNVDWKVYWDDGNNFIEYNESNSDFILLKGRAFWILNKGILSISKQNINSGIQSQTVNIALHKGWNLITNPYIDSIPWIKVKNKNKTVEPIWNYDGEFRQSSLFEPYKGYYFYNDGDLASLSIPYREFFSDSLLNSTFDKNLWEVNISLSTEEYKDESLWFGINVEADKKLDKYDFRKPRIIGEVPPIYFLRSDWDKKNSIFASDIRPKFINYESWEFEVCGSKDKLNTLSFSGIKTIPLEYAVFLVETSTGRSCNLRDDTIYNFIPISKLTKFKVLVGREEFIKQELSNTDMPKEYILGNNYPNPFNPSTIIPLEIPFKSDINLAIYDILGRNVRIIYCGFLEQGRYTFEWDGKDEFGSIIPSGIYFYRLTTTNGTKMTKKLLLMK
jgi:hypothetical protein